MISTVVFALAAVAFQTKASPSAPQTIQAWRTEFAKGLDGPRGWLKVAGLYWMHPGENTIGADSSCTVSLSGYAVPAHVASVVVMKDKALFTTADGAKVEKDGKPFDSGEVHFDIDELSFSGLTVSIIKRGDRVGVRLYDPASKAMKAYRGISWFKPDPSYKVVAKFMPYPKGKTIPITNVIGDIRQSDNPGYVLFVLHGIPCRLEAEAEGDGLFFNFRDQTTGNLTYPAGRFLNTPAPVNGTVELDFNKAVNPPCAWTPFATCPLPPKANTLSVKVEAGEKTHHPVM
jgi:uncharacterized protein (DUF1684 family)